MPVRVNLKPLQKFRAAFKAGMGGPNSPLRRAVRQWAVVYRAAMKARFSKFSRGGGNWGPLEESTKARRRKGRGRTVTSGAGTKTVKQGTVAILFDTGTLIGGLDPSFNPSGGAKEKPIAFGITVGFGGSARHEKGGGTIAQIASIHQAGSPPHLPARPIIVKPDRRTTGKMAEVMEKALGQQWRKATA